MKQKFQKPVRKFENVRRRRRDGVDTICRSSLLMSSNSGNRQQAAEAEAVAAKVILLEIRAHCEDALNSTTDCGISENQ